MPDTIHRSAGLLEEGTEHAHLEQQGTTRDDQYQQRVDGTLGHHRSQGLRERNLVVPFQDTAAGKLTDAGYYQTDGVGYEDGMDTSGDARMLINRGKRLSPSPSSTHLCQDTEGERQQHPPPVHLVHQHMLDPTEIKPSVHPPKDCPAKYQRE